jgi:excisionase family DNA binding protein
MAAILKPEEVARLLGVNARTIKRWAESGKLPGAFRTPGGHWRVPVSAVEAVTRPQASQG